MLLVVEVLLSPLCNHIGALKDELECFAKLHHPPNVICKPPET